MNILSREIFWAPLQAYDDEHGNYIDYRYPMKDISVNTAGRLFLTLCRMKPRLSTEK